MSDADRLLEGEITMSQRVISQKTYVQENVLRSALWRAALGSAPDPIPVNEIPQIFAIRYSRDWDFEILGLEHSFFSKNTRSRTIPDFFYITPKNFIRRLT